MPNDHRVKIKQHYKVHSKMGRYRADVSTEYQMTREETKRKRKANPSPNALRERIRAQHMKEGYQELQKTLPNVPPDTKLPRLNILLLAIDYISYLTGVLSQDDDENNTERLRKATMLHSFIKVSSSFFPFVTHRLPV